MNLQRQPTIEPKAYVKSHWICLEYNFKELKNQDDVVTIHNLHSPEPVFLRPDRKKNLGLLPATSWNCQRVFSFCKKNNIPVDKSLIQEYHYAVKQEKELFSGAIQSADISKVSQKVQNSWDAYQRYGVQWLLDGNSKLLSDEQGMGKTITVLGAFSQVMHTREDARMCVVTTSIGLLNWRDECHKWLDDPSSVCVLNVDKKNSGCPLPEAKIVIVNYDSLEKYLDEILHTGNITHLAVDEAHHVKNPDTKRAKAISRLIHTVGAKNLTVWAADGTPVLKKNLDIHGIMKTLMPKTLWQLGGSKYFLERYCGAEAVVIGVKKDRAGNPIMVNGKKLLDKALQMKDNTHNKELAVRIRSLGAFMHRSHAKHNPGKYTYEVQTYRIPKAALSNLSDYLCAENNFPEWKIRNGMMEENDNSEHREDFMLQRNVLERLVGQGKIAAGIEHCKELVQEKGKIAIFAKNVDIQNAYIEAFPGCARLQANMSAAEKSEHVKRFQTDPNTSVIVCSIGVAQEVINLTAASHAFIAQYITSPKALEQVYRRLARRGQENHVIIEHIHADDTVDDIILDDITEHREKIHELMHSEAEDLIMSRYN